MEDKEQLEHKMSQSLTEGEMASDDPDAAARERLKPRYEIRIQANHDPIVEETLKYRSMADEIDSRYDDYLRRAGQSRAGSGDAGGGRDRS